MSRIDPLTYEQPIGHNKLFHSSPAGGDSAKHYNDGDAMKRGDSDHVADDQKLDERK